MQDRLDSVVSVWEVMGILLCKGTIDHLIGMHRRVDMARES